MIEWLLTVAIGVGIQSASPVALFLTRVQPPPSAPGKAVAHELAGTSWQLVRFQGSDDTTLTPDDKTKYTLQFGADNRVAVRFDCNRGSGAWKSAKAPQLEFGPMAMTRAFCAPPSLHDHMVKQWPFVRSYVIKNGHLFLSLMADGGIYEFERVKPR